MLLPPDAESDETDSIYREGGDVDADRGPGMSRADRNNAKYLAEANEKLEKKGFNEDRGCVDCWCLIVFLIFLLTMCFVTGHSYANGDVNKLTAPLDADLNFCGVGAYTDYPYLYLTNVNNLNIMEIFASGVCVSECPSNYTDGLLPCMTNDVISTCEID